MALKLVQPLDGLLTDAQQQTLGLAREPQHLVPDSAPKLKIQFGVAKINANTRDNFTKIFVIS